MSKYLLSLLVEFLKVWPKSKSIQNLKINDSLNLPWGLAQLAQSSAMATLSPIDHLTLHRAQSAQTP
jgi:hypothetical protein